MTTSPSRPPELFFHVGILVADLDLAIARFADVLGITFNDPIVATFSRLDDPAPHEAFVRCTYSRDGPPHVELLEANGDGLFSLSQGEGVHHIGYWDADPDRRCSLLQAKGVGQGARVVNPDGGTFSLFTRTEDLFGVRLEILDEVSRSTTEQWIETGQFPGLTEL